MKLSIIKTISLTFIISTALSLPSFAKVNDDNQPQADVSIQEKFNIVQGYWKNKCFNDVGNTMKINHKSIQLYFHFKKIDKDNLKNIGKIKLFKNKNCLEGYTVYTEKYGSTTVHSRQLSSMQIIDKNHVQDKYNQDIKLARITKAEYDKVK